VTEFGEMLDEYIVGELSGLGKTIHAFADFNENEFVMDEVLELVTLHEAGWNDVDGDSHILVLVHGSVEVFDVDHHWE
jgi:hypothetical protein